MMKKYLLLFLVFSFVGTIIPSFGQPTRLRRKDQVPATTVFNDQSNTFTDGLLTLPSNQSGTARGLRLTPMGATGAPSSGSHTAGEVSVDSDGKVYVCSVTGSPGTWILIGPGAASTFTVQEGDSNVDTNVSTLDFLAADFDITSSPAGEANIALSSTARSILVGINSGTTDTSTIAQLNAGENVTLTKSFASNTANITITASDEDDNIVINPDGLISQRGTSFVNPATGTYTLDRWKFHIAGSALTYNVTKSLSRDSSSNVPTLNQAGRHIQSSIHLDCTNAETSIDSTDLLIIAQLVEGYRWAKLVNSPSVISFWAKSNKTGIYSFAILTGNASHSCVSEYTIHQSDTWEYKTIPIPPSPSGTFDLTNSNGVFLYWSLMCGSLRQTSTLGQWQSGIYYASTNQVNGADSASNDFRITGVKLQKGYVASPLIPRDFGTELALCQRYYCKTFSYSTAPAQNAGGAGAYITTSSGTATLLAVHVQPRFPVEMRSPPAITTYNPSAANASWRNFTQGSDLAATTANIATTGFELTNNGTGIDANIYGIHWSADAEL